MYLDDVIISFLGGILWISKGLGGMNLPELSK